MKSTMIFLFLFFAVIPVFAVNWTGAVSSSWHNPSNWSTNAVPNSTTNVLIPDVAVQPIITQDASCLNLEIQQSASLEMNGTVGSQDLHVYGSLTVRGELIMTNFGDLYVTGGISWYNTGSATINHGDAYIYAYGSVTFNSYSYITFDTGTFIFLGSSSATLTLNGNAFFNNLRFDKDAGASVTVTGSDYMYVTGNLNGYADNTTYFNLDNTIYVWGNYTDSNTNASYGMRWNAGTLRIDGTAPTINMQSPNGYLNNVTFNTSGTVTLASTLTVNGKLRIADGVLNPNYNNIYVAGDWENTVGPAAFNESTGAVFFNGSGHQYCNYTETFNSFIMNKSGGSLRVNSSTATVTINNYDWTAGSVDVLTGTLTIGDLVDNGLFGGFYCNAGGTINITQDAGQRIDLNGTMYLSGGNVNIYGGSADARTGYYASCTLTMTGGTLKFHDRGIYIYNSPSYGFTHNLTGGTIATNGSLTCNRSNFIPAGGTFEFNGSTDTGFDLNIYGTGNRFYNVRINKSTMSAKVSQNDTELTLNGNLIIDYGTYYFINRTLNCLGDLDINNGGKLSANSACFIKMGSGKSLDVNAGGFFTPTGVGGANVTVTRYDTGNYAINVNGNGNLEANYTIFEYMDANGVYAHQEAVVTTLDNCTFRNGMIGGTLLKFDGSFSLNVINANFPTNAGGGAKNVTRTGIVGDIVMLGYTGSFGGPAYENDISGRVFWPGTDVNMRITNVSWSRPDSYVGAPVTAIVTVNNNGTQDVYGSVQLGFYKNYPTPPPIGAAADRIEFFTNLSAGSSKTITLYTFSSDTPGTWNSWFRVDLDNAFPETNETDNLWQPAIVTDWFPLPDIANLSIARTGVSTIHLDWGYPITVSRFKVYRGSDPYFTPGTSNLIYSGSNDYLDTVSNADKYFYIIKAERDMP